MTHSRTRDTLLLVVGSLLLVLAGAGTVQATTGTPARLGYAAGDDWEPAIASDKSGHVYALYAHYGGVPGCSACPSPTALIQVSNDHGQTWSSPTIVTPGNLGTYQVDFQIMVDPSDNKTVYAAWLQNNKSDVVFTKSSDYGLSWAPLVAADHLNAGTDKPILAARGRDIYIGFSKQQKIYAAVSHNGGTSFSEVSIGSNNQFGASLAGGGAIDSSGNAYFSWVGYARATNGPETLYITKSTDGGKSWIVGPIIDTSTQPPSCAQFSCGFQYLGSQISMAIDSSNKLYVLWNSGQVNGGPMRMYFAASTSGGVNWSPKRDVSLAPAGAEHAFPTITSSGASGDVRIAWMDARNNGRWNVYYRRSTDGGASWSGETLLSPFVSGYSYLANNGFAFPYGDYFEMAVDETGTTHVVWGEGPSYTGPGNIWYNHVP